MNIPITDKAPDGLVAPLKGAPFVGVFHACLWVLSLSDSRLRPHMDMVDVQVWVGQHASVLKRKRSNNVIQDKKTTHTMQSCRD
jgi:hypothetical protein